MTAFTSLSRAMLLGWFRDRSALFFSILFPLMFLVLFGGIFSDMGTSKMAVIQVGKVPLLEQSAAGLGDVLEIQKSDDPAAAREKVRQGDVVAAISQQGDALQVSYSAADQVRSGTVQGVLRQVVAQANAVGVPQRFTMTAQQVEDDSLKAIQYVTPGLLSWAVAMGAAFGAAATLVTWREKRILRRLRLAPVALGSVVGARVGVSVAIALIQTAIFLVVASLPFFGLRLSAYWWMAIPLVVAGTLTFMAIGLVAGGLAKSAEAASGIANLIVLPMAFLSGSFIPLDAAPGWLQTLSNVFPLKHLNQGLLDVMVRGQGPLSVLPELGIVLAFGLVISLIAMKVFRWDSV
ncbi:ABC transporter permease [Herbidospora galbida]|uniref:ABC transporter permease n=1 Tax=Herbidospora galbida TaxID=2575442 RepID=A0A4U3MK51_9ACTN|nr:ABC transporter permease [Herbidospora galbida]TKK89835.1 ABC transporter permease [Herbidospora galbida]